jgi:hypothetical protein
VAMECDFQPAHIEGQPPTRQVTELFNASSARHDKKFNGTLPIGRVNELFFSTSSSKREGRQNKSFITLTRSRIINGIIYGGSAKTLAPNFPFVRIVSEVRSQIKSSIFNVRPFRIRPRSHPRPNAVRRHTTVACRCYYNVARCS